MEQQITVKNLSKTYISKSGIRVKAIDDISFKIPVCRLIFIIGKSGCGKTTLLNLLGGMDHADSGEIQVFGKKINGLKEKQLDEYRNEDVGFVFQGFHLIESLTAKENVTLALGLQNKKCDPEKINALFNKLDLPNEIDKPISELSGGQKQRVAIARALIKNPSLILADEPTGALDAKTGKELLKTFKEIAKERTVIIVSHDMSYAKEYADRIIELSDGEIISDKTRRIDGFFDTESADDVKQEIEAASLYAAHSTDKQKSVRRQKLPFMLSAKLGLKGISKRKTRLLMSMSVTTVALIIFGIFSSFLSYDREKIFIRSMYNAGNYYLPLTATAPFTDANLLNINNSLPNHNLAKNQRVSYNVLNNFDCANYAKDIPEGFSSSFQFNNTLEIDESLSKSLKLKLLSGQYPVSDNEVVISEFMFYRFQELGYKDYYTGETTVINNFSDLIGKKIGSEDAYRQIGGFTVCGVLNTNFDFFRHKKLVDSADGNSITLSSSYSDDLHQALFYNMGFHGRYYEKHNLNDTKVYGSFGNFDGPCLSMGNMQSIFFSISKTGGFPYTKLSPDAPDFNSEYPFGIVWKDGQPRDLLGDNEIIISFNKLLSLTTKAGERISKIYADMLENMIPEEQARQNLAESCLSGLLDHISFQATNTYVKRIVFAGIYFLEESNQYNFYNTAFVSDAIYGDLQSLLPSFKNYDLFIALTGNFRDDVALAKSIRIYDLPETNDRSINTLYYKNDITSSLVSSEAILLKLNTVFIVLTAVLAVFSFIAIFNYFSTSIIDEYKKIGIMRAMGAKKSDIFKIYYLRSLFIILCVAAISIAGSFIGITILNGILHSKFLLIFTLLPYNIITPLLIMLLGITTITLASIIPILKITRKSPVESLRSI